MRRRRYEEIDRHIGEQVRLLAWQRKIPVTVLAKRAGVGYTTLTRKMHGGTTWAAGELVSVAAALGVSPTDLLPPAREEGEVLYLDGKAIYEALGRYNARPTTDGGDAR